MQLKHTWNWADYARLTYGVDMEEAKQSSRRYSPKGAELAPYSANSKRNTTGFYAQQDFKFNNDATNVYVGARYDRVRMQTLATPLKTDFSASKASFNSFNPSIGAQHTFLSGFNLHATYGQGFISPDAMQLTGMALTKAGNKQLITRGNPDLKPETSKTWDIGAGWSNGTFEIDGTYFDTHVKNRVVSTKVTDTAALSETTYTNANTSRMRGLELQGRWNFAPGFALSLAGTRYFQTEDFTKGVGKPANNVPKQTYRLSLDGKVGNWSGRLAVRHVGSRYDNDWVNAATYGQQVRYDPYTTADVSVQYRIAPQHTVRFSVENLGNAYYWEKFGFPQPGRQVKLAYTWELK